MFLDRIITNATVGEIRFLGLALIVFGILCCLSAASLAGVFHAG